MIDWLSFQEAASPHDCRRGAVQTRTGELPPRLPLTFRRDSWPAMSCTRWVFVLLAVAGCSDPQDRFVSFGSARFQYHARADDTSVGPSVLAQLERYGAAADALLGLSATDHLPIAYYKYRDLADFQEHGPCNASDAGCEFQRSRVLEVHSPLSVDEHELTHAYTAALGRPLYGDQPALRLHHRLGLRDLAGQLLFLSIASRETHRLRSTRRKPRRDALFGQRQAIRVQLPLFGA
jgi:hypothetical protein